METTSCHLCPRQCQVDREKAVGYCTERAQIRIARAAPRYWEEPCISGTKGSGTIFFTGCNLKCVYCQNQEIAHSQVGKIVSAKKLYDICFSLQDLGVHNINLVTATHFSAQLITILTKAKQDGLRIPIVYNCGGYESVESLQALEGLIDIYLPDFKYMSSTRAKKYSAAPDYPTVAKKALSEMVRQTGKPVFDETHMMKRGTIVRHLVLPGGLLDSKCVLRYLHETYGNQIYISIMSQYTPMPSCTVPELTRKLTEREYEDIVQFALQQGITQAFIQEGEAAKESFIPPFDLTGV